MRLTNALILFFGRRGSWARGRLAYRLLFDLVVTERPATRRHV